RSSSRSASSSFGGRSSRSGSSSFSRSSSRASSSSFRGSSFGRSTSHINYRPVYINNSRGGVVHRTSRTSSAGCITAIIVVVIITILVIALYVVASNSGMEVTKSTIERVALPKGSVNETGYYTDELGWIRNKTKLETGLKNFYNKTGVQPYLYITDSINGTHYPDTDDFEIFANQLYDELFTDEAHLLFIFLEYNNEFTNFYLCGAQAKTVIDSEAADILLDYIDRYYYDSSLSDEEVFSKAFSDAADRIMTITRSPWSYFFIVIGVLLILVVLFRWWQKSKEQKNLEREQREKILNTPLEQFGSDEAEDLAKKYEQND
ncbi:MAG: hypothetical protein GX283_04735, partial [Clostridiaceae bacterium]|nr:hypothetical protein [Clostridiaceae bacterium]